MAITLISEPEAITFSKNPIDFVLQATAFSDKDNYKIKFEVEFQSLYNAGPFDVILSGDTYPGEDGKVSFKLETLLHGYVRNAIRDELPLPHVLAPTVMVAKISRQYRVRYTESYDIPAVEQAWTTSAEKKVLLGGVTDDEWTPDYLTTISNLRCLLTNYPDFKQVGYDQPEYLSWFNNGTSGGVTIKSYDKNGVLLDNETIATPSALHEVVMIPIGPSELNLDLAAVRYRVSVSITNIRTYHIDPRNHEFKYDLIYFNNYNVPEILRVTGTKQKKLNVDRAKAQNEEGHIDQYDYDFDQILNYTTGHLGSSELDALQELLVYNDLYEINLDRQIYLSLDLVDGSYDISKTRQFLKALKFQARISNKKKVLQLA